MPKHTPDLIELAERVEKAEGPDRQIDADIFEATDAVGWGKAFGYYCNDYLSDREIRCKARRRAPAYTRSLGAALTLVPEGCVFGRMNWNARTGETSVRLTTELAEPGGRNSYGEATTPALALTAACLRARAAMEDSHAD